MYFVYHKRTFIVPVSLGYIDIRGNVRVEESPPKSFRVSGLNNDSDQSLSDRSEYALELSVNAWCNYGGRQSLHEVCPDGTMEYRNNYTLLANLPSLNIHAIVGSFSFVFKQRGASVPKSFTKTLFRFNMPHPPNIETNTIKIQISIPKEEQVYVNTLEPPVIVDKKWEKEKMNPLEDAILEVTSLRVYRITEPPAQLPTLKVIPKSDKGKTK
jgi:hypothetical protein